MKFAFIHNGQYVIIEQESTDFLEDFVFKGTYISKKMNEETDLEKLKYEARDANYQRVYNKKGKYGTNF